MSFQDHSVSLPGDGMAPIRSVGEGIGLVDFGQANVANANVLFYRKLVPDVAATAAHGRFMQKTVIHVRIQQPGTKDYADDPVANKPWAKTRYSRQWEQFEKSVDQIPDGSQVSLLFPQNPEFTANFGQYGIHTVEQLAGMLDADLQNIGIGGTQARDRAKKYLEMASKGVGLHKLEAELAQRDNRLEVQANQLALLTAQLNKLMAERNGVPQTMIPQGPAPVAFAHAAGIPSIFPTQFPVDVPHVPPVYQNGPSETADAPQPQQAIGVAGPTITELPKPRRGWPKGKPRGPRGPSSSEG